MRHQFVTYARAEAHIENRLKAHSHNPDLYNLKKVVDTHNLRHTAGFIAVVMDLPDGDLIDLVKPHTWSPATVRYDLHTGDLSLIDADGQEILTERMRCALPLMAEIRQHLAARGVHTTVGEGLVAECDVLAGVRS